LFSLCLLRTNVLDVINPKQEGTGHSFLNLPGGLPAHVLAYVGPGEWTYVGAVSKRCQEAYLSALSAADKPASSASHRATSFAAIVASASRLQYACAGGLLDSCGGALATAHYIAYARNDKHAAAVRMADLIALQAGKLADKETLLWLKTSCHCLWRGALCNGAIVQGRLDLLKWLHEEQQCNWTTASGCLAARHSQLAVLKYVYSKFGVVPEPDAARAERVRFSLSAVESDSTELLQWCYNRQLLCDSTGSEERLHARAVRLLHFNAAKWLEERGFEGS
jgi:hypothetical protein